MKRPVLHISCTTPIQGNRNSEAAPSPHPRREDCTLQTKHITSPRSQTESDHTNRNWHTADRLKHPLNPVKRLP